MNFLQLVQKTMKRAGVREDVPTTLVGATGIVEDFKDYVADTYRKIQSTAHGERWFFRQALDQSFDLVASQGSYAMPAGMEDINWSTVTLYTDARIDEAPIEWVDYYAWRMGMDTRTVEDTRPQWVAITPQDTIEVFPYPDKVYTFRYDGVRAIDELEVDADEPLIPERYQWAIIWGAVKRYAKHHEDGAKYADAEDEYRPVFDSLVEHQTPETRLITGQLYGQHRQYGK